MAESKAVVKKQTLEEVLMVQADQDNLVLSYQLAKQVEREKMLRGAAMEMAKLSWGGKLSDATRGAIARWALENDIDPLRHFDVLGNNLYANARYYYDRVASEGNLVNSEVIILAPLVSIDFTGMPVSDKQKAELEAEAQALNAERLSLQMIHGVPEGINKHSQDAAAVLIRLFWRDGSVTEGINWAGKWGQKKGDPVGEEHPVKTATTRAFRKAALTKVSVHQFDKKEEGAPAYTIGKYIDADREERHAQVAVPPQPGAPRQIEPGGGYDLEIEPTPVKALEDDPYGDETSGQAPAEAAPVRIAESAEAEDPDAEERSEELALDD